MTALASRSFNALLCHVHSVQLTETKTIGTVEPWHSPFCRDSMYSVAVLHMTTWMHKEHASKDANVITQNIVFKTIFFSSVSSRCDSYGRWILTVSYFQASPFFLCVLIAVVREHVRLMEPCRDSPFSCSKNQLIYVPHFHNYAIGCYKSECGIRRP